MSGASERGARAVDLEVMSSNFWHGSCYKARFEKPNKINGLVLVVPKRTSKELCQVFFGTVLANKLVDNDSQYQFDFDNDSHFHYHYRFENDSQYHFAF